MLDTVKELYGVVVVCRADFVCILDESFDDDWVGFAVDACNVQ